MVHGSTCNLEILDCCASMPHHLSVVVLVVTVIFAEMHALVFHKTEKAYCKNPFSTVAGIFHPYDKTSLKCIGSTASNLDYPLIPSLFPKRLPPSIKFVVASTSDNLRRRRKALSHLNWIQVPDDPPVVNMVISASGLSFVPFESTDDWFGFVNTGERVRDANRRPENVIKRPTCKFNQMPNGTTLDHKVEFLRHYRRYQKRFSSWDWHLPAFILPDEIKKVRLAFSRRNPEVAWIYKPSTTANSAGIEVLRAGNLSFIKGKRVSAVVQKYMADPFLLDDAKVEPRLYIVITSIHPLRIYAFNNSFTKIILDYELNVWRHGFCKTRDEKTYYSEQTFKYFWPRMATAGFDVEKLKSEMMDITIKAIFMGEKEIYEASRKFPRKTSYQFYNVDFMWRKDMKPYLIELNRFPAYKTGYHYKHCRHHLADMLTLVGHQVNNISAEDTEGLKAEEVTAPCDCEEALKTDLGVELKEEDMLNLMEAEDELNRLKGTGFSRVFPSSEMFQYLQYVESDVKPYLVQFAWERAFGEKRKDAVCYLRCVSRLDPKSEKD